MSKYMKRGRVNFEVTVHEIDLDHELRCLSCGLSLQGFIGRQGYACPACKEAFSHPEAEALIPGLTQALSLADLKQRLEKAVSDEDYEMAARLRDIINNVGD